jgi:hypothetical protein
MTMKNVILWDIKTQFLPHIRHITSPLQTEPSRLSFDVGDYEKCHILEYRNPVRTSQETLRLLYRAQPVYTM